MTALQEWGPSATQLRCRPTTPTPPSDLSFLVWTSIRRVQVMQPLLRRHLSGLFHFTSQPASHLCLKTLPAFIQPNARPAPTTKFLLYLSPWHPIHNLDAVPVPASIHTLTQPSTQKTPSLTSRDVSHDHSPPAIPKFSLLEADSQPKNLALLAALFVDRLWVVGDRRSACLSRPSTTLRRRTAETARAGQDVRRQRSDSYLAGPAHQGDQESVRVCVC